jgi:hypothetical protein
MTTKKIQTSKDRAAKVLRVNTYSVTHAITPSKTPKARKPVAVLRDSRIAPSAGVKFDDLFKRGIYKTGDGETVQPPRPGSLDHLQFKSRGF